MHDVIIVGGGAAGLSAALVLGRCRRRVLVIDSGSPRNTAADAVHGFLTRDGANPRDLLIVARDQLRPYEVEFHAGKVVDAVGVDGRFKVTTDAGQRFESRKLLLATGVRDVLPEIEGLRELYGRSAHHCPYCDGWEWRDKRIAVIGSGKSGLGLSLKLRGWSDDVMLLTHGAAKLRKPQLQWLAEKNVPVRSEPIARVEGEQGHLRQVVFERGEALERDAIFFCTTQVQRSEDLAGRLGCEFDRRGGVVVDARERTCVPGLYVAGDASRDVQFVIVAAAEGATAATALNKEFLEEEGLLA